MPHERVQRDPQHARGKWIAPSPRLAPAEELIFRLNALAVQLLGIKKGDGIVIAYDEKEG